MERNDLLKKVHCLENDEVIDLGNDYIVKRSFDTAYFMCNNKIWLELHMLSQQTFNYKKRLNQFVDYIKQYV